jgi:predicted CXXCH cytochrome family protein
MITEIRIWAEIWADDRAGIPSIFLCLTLLAILTGPVQAATYVGSEQCASCHEKETELWRESHHYQAMLPATEETVLADFSNTSFEYAGITSRFYKKGDRFFVETDNEKGELQEFEVSYTFGFYPLQEYLIPFPRGRYQALNIVWDSRPQSEGGQRWVHLYPDDAITFEDGLHWTGSFQNWNSRCAACHSTGLKKNYDSETDSFQTSWEEINLGCESCHGPASAHLDLVKSSTTEETDGGDHSGFAFSPTDRGDWGPAEAGSRTFKRLDGQRPAAQVEMCGGCHARRSEIVEDHLGKPFDDTFQLRLLESGLYFADGQIEDEVYVYGSFLQSKMFQAGVVCSNCHDPHSNKVLAEDNSLCAQCHSPAHFDTASHHHHETGSAGSSCVNCHMPVKTYMVVDDRHDHSFRIPEPRLTQELGTPNTCNQCHQDKEASWAIAALDEWGVSSDIRAVHAQVLNRARQGDTGVISDLLALANDPQKPAIIRATATLETRNFPSRDLMQALQPLLTSSDALVRAAAVRSLDWLPAPQTYSIIQPLITDPVASVRLEVARQLLELPLDQLPPQYAREIQSLFAEYLASLEVNSDMPEAQMSLGIYHSSTGDPVAAEKAYRRAIKISPFFVPAMLNLADLYRANDMDAQAGKLIEEALRISPEDPAVQHSMGLLLVRRGQLEQAVTHLRKAALLDPMDTRYTYVYAVGLYENGSPDLAIEVLENALQTLPENQNLISALASYYQQQGETEKLQKLMEKYSL